jgi:hypothetical protein
VLVAVLGSAVGCSADIFDVEVQLAERRFGADFGERSGTIPVVPCGPDDAVACGEEASAVIAGESGDATVRFGCDPDAAACFGEADARIAVTLNVLDDDDFTTKVQRRSVSFVRLLDVAYAVPANTLTFGVPQIDVYVGPAGTTRETDEGVVLVDSVPALPAGTVIAEDAPEHLRLGDGSAARSFIEDTVRAKQPFTFVVAFTPRIASGDPIPAGASEVWLRPRVRLGVPR